jgi:nicotianamine synthase
MVRELLNKIRKLKTLKPTDDTNKVFSDLVKLALNPKVISDLTIEETKELRQLASNAEYEMELHWADKVINSLNPEAEIQKFWYYQNYIDLTKIEWLALESCCKTELHNKVIFVGSGPLPMTAIILARDYNVQVTLIDIDEKAIEVSKKLVNSLNLSNLISVEISAGESYKNYKSFEVVYLAALAGIDETFKQKILENISEQVTAHTHLVLRSAHSNRTLLYSPINIENISDFTPILEVHPHNDVVNSVIIFKK